MKDDPLIRAGRGPDPFVRKVLLAVGAVTAAVVLLVFLWFAANIVLLLFAGILFAVFLRGLANLLARLVPLGPGWSLLAVILLLLILMGGTGYFLSPRLAEQVAELGERLPEAVERLRAGISDTWWGSWLMTKVPQAVDSGGSQLFRRLAGVFSGAVGVVVNVAFILFAGIYLAAAPGKYVGGLVRLVPLPHRPRAREVMGTLGHQLGWWLVGRFSSMAVVGVLITIGLVIVGMPVAIVLGLLAAVLSFVPVVGPIAAAVPAVLIALLESPTYALTVTLVYVVVQSLESYIITPLIEQRAVSLPPVMILLSQLVFGLVSGVLGVALATPLTVALVVLVRMLYVHDTLGDPEIDGAG